MGELKVYCAQLGPVVTNTYILVDEEIKEAVIIDPADHAEGLIGFLEENGLTLDCVLLTHGHYDHINALEGLREKYDPWKLRVYASLEGLREKYDPWKLRVYAAKPEQEVLMVKQYNMSDQFGEGYTTHANMMINDRQIFEVTSAHKAQCFYTPGHTLGSCCYYFKKEGWLFTGDTLFAGSIGRTDLPTGDSAAIMKSVNEVVMGFPDETVVFPGHGPSSTIGQERKTNPYVYK